ncbi:MAG TPA: response regulator [Anaerolineae bacterium]|nr:response regulator [Anaerolineae bacterium]
MTTTNPPATSSDRLPPLAAERNSNQGVPAVRTQIDAANAYILVVEDNIQNFILIARLMAYLGVKQCQWKASGWQVLEFADSMPRVDLILLDIHLPYEDGFEALSRLRSEPRFKDTLIIAVTADANELTLKRAKQSGFDGFIGKPIDPDRFPDQIKTILHGDPVWSMR